MKFNNEELRAQIDPEKRRAIIKEWHLRKHPEDLEVFVMPVVKKPMVGHLLRSGFKICASCNYLIDTEFYFCSLCGRKFRTRIIHKSSKKQWNPAKDPAPLFFNKIKVLELVSGKKWTLKEYHTLDKPIN